MPTLFDSIRIGDIELDNRIIMAPMTRSRANDAGVQPGFAAEYYRQRASAGLIITEATNVSPIAKGYVRTPGIYTAEQSESWRTATWPYSCATVENVLFAKRGSMKTLISSPSTSGPVSVAISLVKVSAATNSLEPCAEKRDV